MPSAVIVDAVRTPLGKRSWKLIVSSTSLNLGSFGVVYSIAETSVGSSPVTYRAAFSE